MAQNYYEVSIKAGALTSYDISHNAFKSLRILSGVILSTTRYSTRFLIGSAVICYLPPSQFLLQCSEDIYTAKVSEEFMIPKPSSLSFEQSVLGMASLIKSLNALHYTLNVLQNENILIINASDSVPSQICLNLGLNVFYISNEDYKNKATRILNFPNSLLHETGGLGVNHVLDFSNTHDHVLKKNIIDCLGIRSKWAVCDCSLQIDPPESFQLFMRNASICFFNENIWVESGTDHGKFLHLMHTAIKYLIDGIEARANKSFLLSEIEEAYNEKLELILLKSI